MWSGGSEVKPKGGAAPKKHPTEGERQAAERVKAQEKAKTATPTVTEPRPTAVVVAAPTLTVEEGARLVRESWERELEEVKRERDVLRSERDELREDLEDAYSEARKMRSEIDGLRARAKDAEKRLARLLNPPPKDGEGGAPPSVPPCAPPVSPSSGDCRECEELKKDLIFMQEMVAFGHSELSRERQISDERGELSRGLRVKVDRLATQVQVLLRFVFAFLSRNQNRPLEQGELLAFYRRQCAKEAGESVTHWAQLVNWRGDAVAIVLAEAVRQGADEEIEVGLLDHHTRITEAGLLLWSKRVEGAVSGVELWGGDLMVVPYQIGWAAVARLRSFGVSVGIRVRTMGDLAHLVALLEGEPRPKVAAPSTRHLGELELEDLEELLSFPRRPSEEAAQWEEQVAAHRHGELLRLREVVMGEPVPPALRLLVTSAPELVN